MHSDKPLFWHQGLFLQPQHLQLVDRHQLYRLKALWKYGLPYFWGVSRLRVREGALERKMFEVSDIEVFFEGGHLLTFPGNALLEPRSFEKAWEDSGKPFTVYLGLRRWDVEGGNVSTHEDTATTINTMFAVPKDPVEQPDLLASGPPAQLKPMSYVLRLFWEDEIDDLGAYHIIPLARLERDVNEVRLDETFVPPCITMNASAWLKAVFRDINDQVISRCRRLEQYKNPSFTGSGNLEIASAVFLMALRSLNRFVPLLDHYAATPHVHPWHVYGVLRQLVGELSSFSGEVSALGEDSDGAKMLPEYDHTNIGECFEAARKLIGRVLDSLTAGPEFMEQFVFDDPYFTVDIPERVFTKGMTFWLLVKADKTEQMPKLLEQAKLSATRGMSNLLAMAVHGIGLESVQTLPPGLPHGKDMLCFRMDTDSPQWAEVVSTGSLSLYWDNALSDTIAYVVAIRG